jgi:hypothetical protein
MLLSPADSSRDLGSRRAREQIFYEASHRLKCCTSLFLDPVSAVANLLPSLIARSEARGAVVPLTSPVQDTTVLPFEPLTRPFQRRRLAQYHLVERRERLDQRSKQFENCRYTRSGARSLSGLWAAREIGLR